MYLYLYICVNLNLLIFFIVIKFNPKNSTKMDASDLMKKGIYFGYCIYLKKKDIKIAGYVTINLKKISAEYYCIKCQVPVCMNASDNLELCWKMLHNSSESIDRITRKLI